MAANSKKSTAGLKFLLASLSLAGVLGLWSAFASKAQLDAAQANSGPTEAPASGQVFLPEMPTLVPVITLDPVALQAEQSSSLRTVSIPTPQVQQAAPQIRVESIIVGNTGSGSSGGGGSVSAPSTSTGSSK